MWNLAKMRKVRSFEECDEQETEPNQISDPEIPFVGKKQWDQSVQRNPFTIAISLNWLRKWLLDSRIIE